AVDRKHPREKYAALWYGPERTGPPEPPLYVGWIAPDAQRCAAERGTYRSACTQCGNLCALLRAVWRGHAQPCRVGTAALGFLGLDRPSPDSGSGDFFAVQVVLAGIGDAHADLVARLQTALGGDEHIAVDLGRVGA